MRAARVNHANGVGAERLAVREIVAESAADLACALLQATDYGILMTDPQGRDLVGNRRCGAAGDDAGGRRGEPRWERAGVGAAGGGRAARIVWPSLRRGAAVGRASAGVSRRFCPPG